MHRKSQARADSWRDDPASKSFVVRVTAVCTALTVAVSAAGVFFTHLDAVSQTRQSLDAAARAQRDKPYNDFIEAARRYLMPNDSSGSTGGEFAHRVALADRVFAAVKPIYIYGSPEAMTAVDLIVSDIRKGLDYMAGSSGGPGGRGEGTFLDGYERFQRVMCLELAVRSAEESAAACTLEPGFPERNW